MKILILFFLLCAAIIYPQEKKIMSEQEKKLDDIRLKYIPDKRTAVFLFDVKDENGKTIISGETNILPLKEEIEQTFSGKDYVTTVKLLPSEELAGKLYGVINLSVANFRVKPDNGEEMATQGLLGHPVNVFKKHRGYYLAQTIDKYISWVDDDGVSLMDKEEFTAWSSSDKVIFTSDFGFAYSMTDKNSVPVSDLVKGNILKKISVEGEFTRVEYPDKRIAFIPNSDVKDFNSWVTEITPDKEKIKSDAFRFMGIPYLWGGTSVKGMDCSGFTKTVFFNNGYILSRDASQQVNSGDPVDISKGFGNLTPGDLLFFGRAATDTSKERVSHVAIYIGDNDFIHASGRVRVNSLDKSKDNFSAYRFNSLLRAKRIIGAKNTDGILEIKNLFNINGLQP